MRQFLLWWDAYTEGKGEDPYAALGSLFGITARADANSNVAAFAPKWDTILIIALSIAFGVVLLMRQRQALGP